MKRIEMGAAVVAALLLAACGESEPGGGGGRLSASETVGEGSGPASQAGDPGASPAGALSQPEWFKVDHDAKKVTMRIVAGATKDLNGWNYNGLFGGKGKITVPEGYAVSILFKNDDRIMAHSIGVDARTEKFPATFAKVEPVFEGAVSPHPTSLTRSTLPGDSATVNFTAEKAGNYALVCYVPGHAVQGMWVAFAVSAEGKAGVKM